jgi:hypothetical protein
MRSLSVGVFAVAALLCATSLSLRWSHGNDMSLSAALDSADAAELNLPVRHHRSAIRHRHYAAYYSRLYDLYCDGPYVGGGINGGTYYGGPWIDLRCYGGVY